MRRIIIFFVIVSFVFGGDLEERVTKLEKEVEFLKSQLNEIGKLKNNLKNSQSLIVKVVNSNVCNGLKIVDFKYKFNNEYFKSYDLFYTIYNNYRKPIKYIKAYVTIKDNDDNTLIEDFIKRDIKLLNKNKEIIKTHYVIDIDEDLAIYLKDMNKSNLSISFRPKIIEFEDGSKLKCK